MTAAPDSVWNAHDAVDCNCSNLTLYLSAVFGCITQSQDKKTGILGSITVHLRSRHFDFSIGPDCPSNFGGIAISGVDRHAPTDAQVALHQEQESLIKGHRWRHNVGCGNVSEARGLKLGPT